jgi:hypothetical protein
MASARRARYARLMTELWSEQQARWVFRRSATLASRGAEPVGKVVLPNSAFFPDVFDGSPKSVLALWTRMKEHAGLDFIETELTLVDPEEGSVTSCSSGGCSSPGTGVAKIQRLVERADGSYAVQLATTEVKNGTVLTTMMARIIGALFLSEADLGKLFARTEVDAASDLAAVHLGLGVLVMNGAAIELKGCGGMKIHSATSLSAGEAALALAIYTELARLRGDDSERTIAKHLGAACADAFRSATAFVAANSDVVESIAKSPKTVEDEHFTLREKKGWLVRAFGFGRTKTRDDELAELERTAIKSTKPRPVLDAKKAARLREIQALVEESFD